MYRLYAKLCRLLGTNKVIYDRLNNEPYLERFYLVPRWLTFGKYRIVLHRFWKSDDDGGLHDHPWKWASYILEGGYYEHTPKGKEWRKPGTFSGWRKATDLHRVELNERGNEIWTIFFMGKKEREWGFVSDETKQWIHWKEYLENKTRKVI